MNNPQKLKVDGYSNLIRDTNSNGIVNTDKNGYESYVQLRKIKNKEANKISKIESELSALKNDIDEIKSLLLNISKNT